MHPNGLTGEMKIEIRKNKILEDYQLEELVQGKLLINKYNLSLKYTYELSGNWKELFFDMLNQNPSLMEDLAEYELFEYMKKNYNNIIDEYGLDIDIRDYINLTDYITLKEWLQDEDNSLEMINKHYVLLSGIPNFVVTEDNIKLY